MPNAAAAIVGATTAIATTRSSADSQGASSARSARCPLRARTTWLAIWRGNTKNPRNPLIFSRISISFLFVTLTSVHSVWLSKSLSLSLLWHLSPDFFGRNTYLYVSTMIVSLVSKWVRLYVWYLCDPENTSSLPAYLLLLYTEILLELLPLVVVVETGIDAKLHWITQIRFCFWSASRRKKKNAQTNSQLLLSFNLSLSLSYKTCFLLRDRRRRLRVKLTLLMIPLWIWMADKRQICIHKEDGGIGFFCTRFRTLFYIFSNRDPWIAVERFLILAIILGVLSTALQDTQSTKRTFARRWWWWNWNFFFFTVYIFSSLILILSYLALPLLHLAIQPTKSWPRVGGQKELDEKLVQFKHF